MHVADCCALGCSSPSSRLDVHHADLQAFLRIMLASLPRFVDLCTKCLSADPEQAFPCIDAAYSSSSSAKDRNRTRGDVCSSCKQHDDLTLSHAAVLVEYSSIANPGSLQNCRCGGAGVGGMHMKASCKGEDLSTAAAAALQNMHGRILHICGKGRLQVMIMWIVSHVHTTPLQHSAT